MSGTTNRSKDVLDNETDMIGANLNADGNSIYLSCLTKHHGCWIIINDRFINEL